MEEWDNFLLLLLLLFFMCFQPECCHACVCVYVCVRALRATMASGLHDPRRSKKQAEREKERKKQTNLAEIALRNHLAKMCTGVREGERESGKGRAREEEGGSSSCCVLI